MISDNIVNSGFLNNSILKSKLITSILENDFNIYGSFLREIIFNNKTWHDFDSHAPSIINILGLEKNKEALEKSLKGIIESQISLPTDLVHNKSNGVNYLIKIHNIQFLLHTSYVKVLDLNNIISLSWDIRLIVDLDLLYLSKYSLGVFHINNYLLSNYNLISIIKNITNRKFRVVSSFVTSMDFEYLKKLISDGYQNLDSKIFTCLDSHDCAICYDNEDINYSQLSCGHIFHEKCLKKAIKLKFDKPKTYYFECPYCSKKYFNFEVID